MRWLEIRKANILPRFRERFEELGVEIVRAYFTQPIGVVVWEDDGGRWTVEALHEPMQLWLREQYDRAERKESWLITMEMAITILVATELFMSVSGFLLSAFKVNHPVLQEIESKSLVVMYLPHIAKLCTNCRVANG